MSAVIACYRDAPAVPIMHRRLVDVFEGLGLDYEIIFVNDGSPDDAREVLADLATRDRRVTVVNHTRAFGSQSAFTSGMRLATGDAVVLLDGDLQDPPELIPEMVEKWKSGYDVVYGERVGREGSRAMGLGYKVFYRALRRFSYVPVPVDAGDFSLLDRRVVDTLNQLPEKQRFLRGLRAWVGFRQIGVPYVRPKRMFGHSTNSVLKNVGWARKGIISLSYAPINFIAWLALMTTGASFLAIIVQTALRLAFPNAAPKGVTTLLLVMFFLGGMQFLCLSIIGSYLAHIYDEVKGRPSYVVDEILNPPTRDGRKVAPAGQVVVGAAANGPPAAEVVGSSNGAASPMPLGRPGAKRVMVTGAAGFVGANLVRRLVLDGHQVTAVVAPDSRRWRLEHLAGEIEVLSVDLSEARDVRPLVEQTQPEWVFHLAAHGGYSWQTDVHRILRTNLLATVNLLDACRSLGCQGFVHAGSSSEYGFKFGPASESDPIEPNSEYAVAKAAATSYCRFVGRRDGFPTVSLRLYSVYGAYEDPRRLIPTLITKGLRNELPPLVSPDTAHDFVAIDDVVHAFPMAADHAAREPGAIFNVGTGEETSLSEVVDVARRVLGIRAEPRWNAAPSRTWDSPSWVADTRRIREVLGWHPQIELEQGFRRTVQWLASTPEVWDAYDVGGLADGSLSAAGLESAVPAPEAPPRP